MLVREYTQADLPAMFQIWNEVVDDGVAFPQEEGLDLASGAEFFAAQSYTAVVEDAGAVRGLYILHPNNVGRCGRLCNASYAVASDSRGQGLGAALVRDSLKKGKELGFNVMQFNAVVESNVPARRLYERLGFVKLGTIPEGFRLKDGSYANICLYYYKL